MCGFHLTSLQDQNGYGYPGCSIPSSFAAFQDINAPETYMEVILICCLAELDRNWQLPQWCHAQAIYSSRADRRWENIVYMLTQDCQDILSCSRYIGTRIWKYISGSTFSGCTLIINGVCQEGHRFQWTSSRTLDKRCGNATHEDNILFAIAVVLSGNNFQKR